MAFGDKWSKWRDEWQDRRD